MSDSQGESGGAWPLIGRDHEIGEIEAAYRRPAVHGVMLLGARGAGKSRVAREAAARLTTGGRRILWIGGRRALRSTAFGAVARLVPGAYDELAMVSRLASDLHAAGPDRPIIVVDDAHLLDDASAAVLAELAARHSVFLIGTVPSGECAPKAFAGLRNSGRIVSLPIGPLSLNAMERLVARALGTGMDAISRRRLASATEGNPLALQALIDAGAVAENGDVHQAAAGDRQADTASGGFADAVAGRWLAEAGPSAREVVEIAACADPVPTRLLEEAMADPAVDLRLVSTAAVRPRRLGVHHASAVHFQERADSLARHRESARTALLDRWWLPVPAHPAPAGGHAAGLPFDDPADRRAWG